MRTSEETKDITLLGQKNVKYEFNYRPDVLETFDNQVELHEEIRQKANYPLSRMLELAK